MHRKSYTSDLQVFLSRQVIPCNLWTSCPVPSINLYMTCCSECTSRMLQMSKLVKPPLSLSLSLFLSLYLKIRSMSSRSRYASIFLDLTVVTYFGMILKICLIVAQSWAASAEGSAWPTTKFHSHGGWCSTHKSCTHGHMTCKSSGGM